MSGSFLIYGATGYTGKLTARTAAERGLRPVLGGRSREKLEAVAKPLGFESRAFGLDDSAALDAALRAVDVVLHIAGPFSATSRPMADACLRTGTHYLDVTGEIDVFEALAARSREAAERGIMLMPGVGFDVVPSDCLAAHLKGRLPDACRLELAIAGMGNVSRGTAKTAVESLGSGTRVRRDGRIQVLPGGPPVKRVDFGDGPRDCIGVSWGDVSTAYHTTGIPDIEAYLQATRELSILSRAGRTLGWLLDTGPAQRLLKGLIDRMPEGPSDAQRAQGASKIVGCVRNETGARAVSRLTTPEGYTLTAHTGLAVVERVLAGRFTPGFRTPAGEYGADFILEMEGCTREDCEA